jgi:soluble lytic murein transglycosylase-like protein
MGIEVALPGMRTSVLIGVLLLPLGLSACTSAGGDAAASLAMTPKSTIDPGLPDTVAVVPTPLAAFAAAPASAAPSAPAAKEAAFAPAAPARAVSEVDGLIAKYAAVYEVPEELVRRVVRRESNFNPSAYHKGYWGLMQIRHATARGMGYDGPAKGLLDAETNLKYAVKYLRGAWLVAGGNHDQAVRLYARGYYYNAKRKGMLDETGLGTDRRRRMATSS